MSVNNKKTVSLVLGSGGARGLAHIGISGVSVNFNLIPSDECHLEGGGRILQSKIFPPHVIKQALLKFKQVGNCLCFNLYFYLVIRICLGVFGLEGRRI